MSERPELAATEAVVGDAETSADVVPTVGQCLRAAREAAQLSVTDIAQALKFAPRQVEALEADDFAALPGNTVVRGFVRSYARFLKLDADTLLHRLDVRAPAALADVRPPDNMGSAKDTATQRALTPLLLLAIVVMLAALLLGAWHWLEPQTRPPTSTAGIAAAPTVLLLPSPEPATAPPAAAGDGPASATTPSGLVFAFEDRSWVEVGDAAGRVLHTGENLAGTRLTLGGKPPFDIVIGNAGRVRLSYAGREIDLAPHTRADVARLRLE